FDHQSADESARLALTSHVLYGLGDWIYSVAVVVLAYQLGGQLALAAAVLLCQAGGRLLGITFNALGDAAQPRALAIATGVARTALIAVLVAVTARDQLWIAMAVAALLGLSGPASEGARKALTPPNLPFGHSEGLLYRMVCRWDQIAMILGSIAAGLAIVLWSERAAFTLAAAMTLAATLMLLALPAPGRAQLRGAGESAAAATWEAFRRLRAFRVLLLALAAGAALGIAIRVLLVEIVLDIHDGSELLYGLFIALAGVGAFAGPLSVPRLLGKLPSELILAGVTAALAVALIAARIAQPLALIVPVVIGCGLLAITAERVTLTVARRVVPDRDLDQALRLLAVAAVAGQAAALALVVALDRLSGSTAVIVALAAGSVFLAALPILFYMGSGQRSVLDGGD
ncbi:MAG TPA: MFS transporter, partial [Thermomicrobiales bacterium]|nr:MFS transporter [Thermomicrobiales bacterium]